MARWFRRKPEHVPLLVDVGPPWGVVDLRNVEGFDGPRRYGRVHRQQPPRPGDYLELPRKYYYRVRVFGRTYIVHKRKQF